ncbi:MAG TPA: ComF family protein [Bacteroidetes bacterium]|nr:ComF family protein [Bacteroidota bacterium]
MSAILSKVKYIGDCVLGLFYPHYCPGCGNPLVKGEKFICTGCILDLPYAYFNNSRKNIVSELLFGRFKIEKANSLCYFVKNGKLQKLLHKLKYENSPEIGKELGIYLGQELEKTEMNDFDIILPVPLHPKKQKIRGYNQSEAIAQGIYQIINKPIDTTSIQRVQFTETQTKKNKFERWDNVKDIFELKKTENIENKHILIVDDVITTGSTLEALANTINKAEGAKISVASVAVAKKM